MLFDFIFKTLGNKAIFYSWENIVPLSIRPKNASQKLTKKLRKLQTKTGKKMNKKGVMIATRPVKKIKPVYNPVSINPLQHWQLQNTVSKTDQKSAKVGLNLGDFKNTELPQFQVKKGQDQFETSLSTKKLSWLIFKSILSVTFTFLITIFL